MPNYEVLVGELLVNDRLLRSGEIVTEIDLGPSLESCISQGYVAAVTDSPVAASAPDPGASTENSGDGDGEAKQLTVVQLRDLLAERGVATRGLNKSELLNLWLPIAAAEAAAASAPDPGASTENSGDGDGETTSSDSGSDE